VKRYVIILSMIALMFVFYPGKGQCYTVDLRGQVASLYVLRDTSGFQDGFMDDFYGVQWRNTLDITLTIKPEYAGNPSVYVDKVYLAYRGAYDAIFSTRRDAFDNVEEKERDDFEIGLDDVEWGNDLREAFVDFVAEGGAQKANLRLGRQIVRWGETDSFNIVNVVNPSDYSYQLAFSNPDDVAIPLWMARLDYTVAGLGFLDSFGIELLAIPDIRPTQLGPTNGKDGFVNFDAPYSYTLSGFDGMGLTRIREDVPGDTWENMEYGISMSIGWSDLEAAFHYFVGHQDNGALDWEDYIMWANTGGLLGASELTFTHPRQRTYGYSFNYFVEWSNMVVRGEGSLTDEEYLMETPAFSNGFDITFIEPTKVYRNMLGIDKALHPTWIGTRSALDVSIEGYWRHVSDWKTDPVLHPSDKRDTGIFTCFLMTDYHHGMIKPRILVMYDTEGTWMTNAAIVYDPDGKWFFQLAQSSFWGNRNAISDFSRGGVMINNSELSFKVGYRF